MRALVSLHGVSSRKNSSFKDRGQCTRIVHTLAHSGVTWPGEVLHAVLAEVDSLSAILLAPPLTHCAGNVIILHKRRKAAELAALSHTMN